MKKSDRMRMAREICGTVWTSGHPQRLMEVLSCEIGPRPAGSRPFAAALRFLSGELKKMGARRLHAEPVTLLAWRDRESRVELLAPCRRTYESVHHVHSAAGRIVRPLVDARRSEPWELDRLGKRLQGAVALVAGHEVSGGKVKPYLLRLRELAQRGAAAVLMRCMYPSLGPSIELASVDHVLPVPVVGVSYEAGAELASFAARGGARVRVEAAGKSYRTRCANLVGELGPARRDCDVIILSAHLDYFHVSPGALDNLTGVVTLLEIARVLAPFQSRFRRLLRLIAFTGEEYGFLGSKAYVRRRREELDRIRFVLNMDSLYPETARGMAVMWAPRMRDYIEKAFRNTQCRVDVRNMFCMSSDYLPFMLAGIPAGRPADLEGAFPPWSHTRFDTADKIPMDWIRLNAIPFAQLLARMLTDPLPLPSRRLTARAVRARVEEEGVRATLESQGFVIP